MTNAFQAAADTVAALLSRWSQTDRLLHLHTVLDANHGPDILLAEQLRGIEGIGILNEDTANLGGTPTSHGFKLELTALSQDAHLELKTLIGQPVLLELLTSSSRSDLRPFHGHITRVECIGSNGAYSTQNEQPFHGIASSQSRALRAPCEGLVGAKRRRFV